MTDKERLMALLHEWGVPYKDFVTREVPATGGGQLSAVMTGIPSGSGYDELGEFTDSDKVTGYFGFYTMFRFYEDGSFADMGAWE